jgi:hypothetical protein
MTVTANEKAQVGHYFLLKRDYTTAWQWYTAAEQQLAEETPPGAARLPEYVRRLTAPDDFRFFEHICLTKLGKKEEAQAKLEQFQQNFAGQLPSEKEEPLLGVEMEGRSVRSLLQDLLDLKNLSGALLRQLYMAEVFLSIDAAEDGERFFRQAMDQAPTETQRLSSALVLSQFLLLQKKHREYAELAIDVLAPLLAEKYRGPLDDLFKGRFQPEML